MDTPESWFHRRAAFYVETQVLFHLNEVGVWTLLSDGEAHTAERIAEMLALNPQVTAALLDYVFEVDDMLIRDGEQRYSLSGFGMRVVERFSARRSDGQRKLNMFDVRVGAYGVVWRNLSEMLTGKSQYGRELRRDGRYAEEGVSKLAPNFYSIILEYLHQLGPAAVLEVGVGTGLLEKVAESYTATAFYGLDKNEAALRLKGDSASSKRVGNMRWILADYFDVETWLPIVEAECRGIIYSLHFHELLSRGEARFVDTLRKLRIALPNWTVIALEQPRLPHSAREGTAEALWLYAQSNVLIHHLIGNGRILDAESWVDLGHRAGCHDVEQRACGYLGYTAFVFRL